MICLDIINKSFNLHYQRYDFHWKKCFCPSFVVPFTDKNLNYLNPPLHNNYDNKIEDHRASEFHVIEKIKLTLEIGSNWCGKRTLLRLIEAIYFLESDRLTVQSRISPLIEWGTEFHPKFSSRENVFINGQILGLSPAYLRKRCNKIVKFPGIPQFIDLSVRICISGMFVRLAFSVIVNVDPEIRGTQ